MSMYDVNKCSGIKQSRGFARQFLLPLSFASSRQSFGCLSRASTSIQRYKDQDQDHTETETETVTDPKTETETETDPKTETETKIETKTETETETETNRD